MIDIRRANTTQQIYEAKTLFDRSLNDAAIARFLATTGHHLLIAYDDGQPVGMITGAEITHPDSGTEMFLNELGVDESHRNKGIGAALVSALVQLARDCGCRSMWVGTEPDNIAALATYRSVHSDESEESFVMLSWSLIDDH